MYINIYPKVEKVIRDESTVYVATLGDQVLCQQCGVGATYCDAVEDLQARLIEVNKANMGELKDDPEIIRYLTAGEKIKAIKRYRELTGAGLTDSVIYINYLMQVLGIDINIIWGS